ncbi:MAG: division/cell wall cluster transcriptional repressor MraZ [Candidatus Aureabacteria bacterium]|nr:division/cell wall cluster transcriptional repressor MraZ [Candidatus Auribacterota bacterium]
MFYGEYEHTVDEKGRLIVPSKLRAPMKDNFIDRFFVTRGFEKCLFIFAEQEWRRIEEKFRQLPITKSVARSLARNFYSAACESDCDKQGRILIPKRLLDYAGLQKEVIIIGVSKRIEVWDKENWKIYSEKSLENYEQAAEDIVGFDF